jgi:DNA ligase 1
LIDSYDGSVELTDVMETSAQVAATPKRSEDLVQCAESRRARRSRARRRVSRLIDSYDGSVELTDVVETSAQVAATPKRSEKVVALGDLLSRLDPDEVVVAIGFLLGAPRQGRIGVGWATLVDAQTPGADSPSLTLADVDVALSALAALQGPGSQRERNEIVGRLFSAATDDEQQYLFRVLTGEMRQGANEGVIADAVAKASGRPIAEVRRAAMLLGDLGAAAQLALAGGDLTAVGLTPLVAVQPMLAATSASVTDAIAITGRASVEFKLDGARIQVHRLGEEVRVYTRSLNEIAARVPTIVAAALSLTSDRFVLDGEALGLDLDGNPLKFQDTMSAESSLRPFFFDVLHAGGDSVVDLALEDRKRILRSIAPAGLLLPTIDTDDGAVGERFAADALAAGHEGVVVKALSSPYQAGRRGNTWRKVKPVHTFDLVVLAAEWGHGRRTGWLSNLHLGARGPDGEFVMVGKTFKGLTDELLRWQTETFPPLATRRTDHVVWLRPELVVEIAIDGVQRSPRYPGGVALRFARVKQYRPDKRPAEADTIETLRSML